MNAAEAIKLIYDIVPELKGKLSDSNERTLSTRLNFISAISGEELTEELILSLCTGDLTIKVSLENVIPTSTVTRKSKDSSVERKLNELDKRVTVVEREVKEVSKGEFLVRRVNDTTVVRKVVN